MKKSDDMFMIAGLDIGNGYVKGCISTNGGPKTTIDYLSGAAIQTNSCDIKEKEENAKAILDDIFNYMEASFDSLAVETHSIRLFGRRAVSSGKSMEEFDVSSTISKASQDLSGVLVLGSLAGRALQEYYAQYGKLPDDTIHVTARIALALPITEYRTFRKIYAEKFKDATHMVSISNFEKPVRVELNIVDVQVVAEGASAQYAINKYGTPLMKALLEKLRERGEALDGITAEDVLAATNTIGIDIGEGTVNFPVFQKGRFNPDASRSFNKGYGTVLEQALETAKKYNMNINSRKALADILLNPTPLLRARYNKLFALVQDEVEGFAMEVTQEFRKVIARAGAYTEVIYVYGGGSGPVVNELYPKLINVVQNLGGSDVAYPVLYLDANYSRNLNREGLFLIAQAQAAADGVKFGEQKEE